MEGLTLWENTVQTYETHKHNKLVTEKQSPATMVMQKTSANYLVWTTEYIFDVSVGSNQKGEKNPLYAVLNPLRYLFQPYHRTLLDSLPKTTSILLTQIV